jgi:hypothetical protein
MGTNSKVFFLGGMGGRSLVFFKVGKWDFFDFPRNYSFGGVGWGGWRKEWVFFLVIFLV